MWPYGVASRRGRWRADRLHRTMWAGTPTAMAPSGKELSLSRLNHRLPWGQTHPEIMQGTAEFHHQIADALLPQADPVFHDATALDTAVDMLDPQPTAVQLLVGRLLFQRELLAAWFLG